MPTISTINLGNLVNDGLGDDLRTAFQKVNLNFSILADAVNITAANTGASGGKLFKDKQDSTLVFRTITAGNKITVTEFTDNVEISCTQPDAFLRINGNSGSIFSSNNTAVTIQGGTNITTSVSGQYLTIDTNINLSNVLLNYDFGPVNAEYSNVVQFLAAAANIDFGTISNPGPFSIDLGTP